MTIPTESGTRETDPSTQEDGHGTGDTATVPVFDGHNDFLARSFEEPKTDFRSGAHAGHLSLEKCRAGGFGGGLFAIFIPPNQREQRKTKRTAGGGTLPAPVPLERAQRVVAWQFARLRQIERDSDGTLRLVSSAAGVEAAMASGAIAAVPHLEGAEAIDKDLTMLELYRAAGIRSIGPVWSRSNRFATGVPLLHRHTPDIGSGLTSAGKELVRRSAELRMNIDLSHLNDQGFWEVAKLIDAPLVCSHSNAWALCENARNVTDRQLDAIARSDGFVGINFGTLFLREDGSGNEATPISRIVEHIRYIADRIGIERVGFGSDFDGTVVPKELGGAAGLQTLIAELRRAGLTDREVRGVARENWVALLRRVWGE